MVRLRTTSLVETSIKPLGGTAHMARPRKATPTYSLHKATGRGRATWCDLTGARQERLMPGGYDSPESKEAFGKLVVELVASATKVPGTAPPDITLSEVLLAFLDYGEKRYRDCNGDPTREVDHIRTVCNHATALFGAAPTSEFGPLALKTVRQKFISLGWCRRMVNQQVERIRRAIKWAAGEELIPFEVYHRLTTVSGLQNGRMEAKEHDPVLPVEDAIVDATLLHLNRHVRGLVEFQRLTGCRPGEACNLHRSDIDTSPLIWTYRPKTHKGQWRGKSRTIAIGPKAQALLKEYFTSDISDYLFSPVRAVGEFRAERAANRKTPRYPSHLKRNEKLRVKNPKHPPADRYNRLSYLTAVTRACDRAFPPGGELAQKEGESAAKWWDRLTPEKRAQVKQWRKEHHWHPNQLRHTFATKIRETHGLEAAQVLLGHSRADVTQVYAERNEKLATSIAAKIG